MAHNNLVRCWYMRIRHIKILILVLVDLSVSGKVATIGRCIISEAMARVSATKSDGLSVLGVARDPTYGDRSDARDAN